MPPGVLDAAYRLPVRRCRRGRHRSDQFDRQPRRIRRAVCDGPFAMGWIKDHTGSYAGGLSLLAALGIIAMGIVLMLGRDRAPERPLAE